ncbi:molybdenum cofactor biosynthesis protein MoaE [Williamsia soli]|uniref:molybdenum cofactor biosynthesis protein MoaE n=1 Tax=Williamsia soli TaxID=364929 RepID=UPI001A9CC23B|nr:molybdenum cofactor biosynthesis protein MoaE [Williamsia soli]
MAAVVARAAVTEELLSTAFHEQLATDAAGGTAGAIVSFVGAVRNHDGGRDVTALNYSAHPTAADVVARVVADVAAGADGVRAVAVSHRIGDLSIGDAALVVAVAADHRGAAFATCALLVDEVKAQLPVWKHQIFADGSDEWVGSA